MKKKCYEEWCSDGSCNVRFIFVIFDRLHSFCTSFSAPRAAFVGYWVSWMSIFSTMAREEDRLDRSLMLLQRQDVPIFKRKIIFWPHHARHGLTLSEIYPVIALRFTIFQSFAQDCKRIYCQGMWRLLQRLQTLLSRMCLSTITSFY